MAASSEDGETANEVVADAQEKKQPKPQTAKAPELEQEPKHAFPPRKREEFSGRDETMDSPSQTSILSTLMGWHPFMRFFCRIARAVEEKIPNQSNFVWKFMGAHKLFFWICVTLDMILIVAGIAGFLLIALHALWPVMRFPWLQPNESAMVLLHVGLTV